MLSISKTSRRRAFVETVRWVVAQRLGKDFDVDVELHDRWEIDRIDCLVRATYLAHELVDEQETMLVPDGPWNEIKAALNTWLIAFDRACFERSIEMLGWRFKVKTRPLVVKRVYHACPHLSKEHKGHEQWIFAAPAEQRLNFRVAHRISGLVEQGIENPRLALEMLLLIQQRLRFTGAFE